MPAADLPYRIELHPDALRRTNLAHQKTTAAGEVKLAMSTLLGPEKRNTSANVCQRKTLPSSDVVATAAMRYQAADQCNLIVALASLFVIVDTATGEVVALEDALNELLEAVANSAARERGLAVVT